MFDKKTLANLKEFVGKLVKRTKTRQKDMVEVILPGLCIKVTRNINLNTPHELTVVVPRAEMRKNCLNEDCSKYEYELIYSSITVVHAPRHPFAEPSSPVPPEMPQNSQS